MQIKKYVIGIFVWMEGVFNFQCLLIEFVIPNLNQIYFCFLKIFKTTASIRFLGKGKYFKFVFIFCEFTKVIM